MVERVITLLQDVEGTWTARDDIRKITAQADIRTEALSALDDTVAAAGIEGDQETTLRGLRGAGIDSTDDQARRQDGRRTVDELDLGGTAPDGRWPSTDDK